MKFSRKEIVFFIITICLLLVCCFQIGYLDAKLESPKQNLISIEDHLSKKILSSVVKDVTIDMNNETILYVSSDVLDKDNQTINRLGVRFIGFTNNKDQFYVEVCDSVNKQCIKSSIIDRITLIKSQLFIK